MPHFWTRLLLFLASCIGGCPGSNDGLEASCVPCVKGSEVARRRRTPMEFGIGIDTHINKWDLVRYVEELGYDRAWVPDSQMIWSDCYATLALAAANTRRIKIGTGVAIAATRIAPGTAT